MSKQPRGQTVLVCDECEQWFELPSEYAAHLDTCGDVSPITLSRDEAFVVALALASYASDEAKTAADYRSQGDTPGADEVQRCADLATQLLNRYGCLGRFTPGAAPKFAPPHTGEKP